MPLLPSRKPCNAQRGSSFVYPNAKGRRWGPASILRANDVRALLRRALIKGESRAEPMHVRISDKHACDVANNAAGGCRSACGVSHLSRDASARNTERITPQGICPVANNTSHNSNVVLLCLMSAW
jgi:hypothetical protein